MSGAVDLSGLKERAQAKPAPTGGPSAVAVEVTEANFEAEVLQRSLQVPVVVVLTSARSDASLQLAQTFERLAGEDDGTWALAVVDVDANMRIAQAFGVQAIPTAVAVAAGRPLADLPGTQPEPQLRQWINAILQAVAGKLSGPAPDEEPPTDPRFEAADEALDRGDLDGAAQVYRDVLAAEPNNAEAKAALRQLDFIQRAESVSADVVAKADADPADIDAQLDAADVQVRDQQPAAAFDRLIATIKRTAGDDRTRVRTRLLELFELFETGDPTVVAARRKLATALY